MSTINLYEAYKHKLNKFGLNDSARFQDSFVEAVNLVNAELNDQVFQNQTLGYIDSFDDVIDERLISFNTLTFGAGVGESTEAMGSREFWAAEWDLEKTSATNGMTDTIDDDVSNVVMSITNGVFSVVGDAVSATATIPTIDTFALRFESTASGNALLVDGDAVALTYTLGDAETSQGIGAITSRIISGFTGYTLNKTRFLSASTLILNFLINEGTGTALVDEVESFSATLSANPVWTTVYIEPSSGLDSQYRAVLNMGLDYHLQDGGEWAIEPEIERERKWYTRGIRQARNIFQQNTTYSNTLGT